MFNSVEKIKFWCSRFLKIAERQTTYNCAQDDRVS